MAKDFFELDSQSSAQLGQAGEAWYHSCSQLGCNDIGGTLMEEFTLPQWLALKVAPV